MVRIKERYILVNILYPSDAPKEQPVNVPDFVVLHQPTTGQFNFQSLLKAIKAEVATLFGDYGSGALEGNLSIKYLSTATSTFILRVKREHYRMVWAALTFMNRVPVRNGGGKPCIFRVVKISGTIRKAEEEAVRQARQLVLAAKDAVAASTSGALPQFSDAKAHAEDAIMLDASDVSDEENPNEEDG
ncbi:Ribonuclease P/MRP protein subunit POP5 [Colletotrichum spinosum]|uniref:Ribonuclease P/MRP protein subunit POP5 n=1 Tax=Colletotrichum spinosum TaxID=1347390 RepID=A0A4R8QL82_9PEZI|nr:Ribonuclease P/MRP protein subunit POP5 [Colletotrichum spinosum]